MWSGIFFALSVTVCIVCSLVSLSAVKVAARASESARRRLSSCESRIESLESSHKDALTLMGDLANRLKMTRVRAAASHLDRDQGKSTEPDPYTQPDEWRKSMNKRLAEARTGAKL